MQVQVIVKKLVLAPLLVLSFFLFLKLVQPVISNSALIFSFDLAFLASLLWISAAIILTSIFFVATSTLSQDWKIIAPLALALSILPFLLLPPLNFYIGLGSLISFLLTNLILDNKLKAYLNFQAGQLLSSPVKNLSLFLTLVVVFSFYVLTKNQVDKTGFQVPDSLIDSALKFIPQDQGNSAQSPQLPEISPDSIGVSPQQLQLLKQNPQLLKQYGLDPKILDSVNQPGKSANPTGDLIKNTVRSQLQQIISPFQQFAALILAFILFLEIQFLTGLLGLFIPPLISLTFMILEKSGVTKFTKEMREVKKLVV